MLAAGAGLVALGLFRPAFADIVGPVHVKVAGEQEDLLLVVPQPAGERVAGVVPGVPVAEPVVDSPGFYGGGVASPQVIDDLRVQGGAAAGAGLLPGLMRVAEGRGDVAGPVLDAPGAEVPHRPAAADHLP